MLPGFEHETQNILYRFDSLVFIAIFINFYSDIFKIVYLFKYLLTLISIKSIDID